MISTKVILELIKKDRDRIIAGDTNSVTTTKNTRRAKQLSEARSYKSCGCERCKARFEDLGEKIAREDGIRYSGRYYLAKMLSGDDRPLDGLSGSLHRGGVASVSTYLSVMKSG